MSNRPSLRIAAEKAIASATVAALLAAGYSVTVDNGADDESDMLQSSRDAGAILAAMSATDEERLYAVKDGKVIGWIYFVYGNEGYDVISDYTTNLELLLDPITGIGPDSLSTRLDEGRFEIVFPATDGVTGFDPKPRA